MLVRHGARTHRGELVAIALVLAAGVGAGLASLEIAQRTDQAYPRYRDDAEVAELVVNPSLTTDQTADLLRSIEGVESVTSDALLTAGPDIRTIGRDLEDLSDFLQVRVSTDGRYLEQDRPAVHRGRMIRDGAEAFISEGAAEELGLDVGDEIPLLFFGSQTDFNLDMDEILASVLGTVDVTIVGVGSFPDEVLPDELIPRQKILVTPEVGARFDCVITHPDPDDPRSIDELSAEFFPPNCSASYHYFSMRISGGDVGAVAVGERIAAAFEEANTALPAAMRENDVGYLLIPSVAREEAKRLDESLSPVVTSLRAFALGAIIVSIAVAVILVLRHARRRELEVSVWRSLGATRRDRALALVGPALVASAAGVVLAVAGAWFASGVGAIASARAVDEDAGRSLSGAVVLTAFVVFVVAAALLNLAILTGASTPWRPTPPSARVHRARANQPSITLGLRAARESGGAVAVLAGSTLAVATVAATLVFSASVVHFVDQPNRYGWPYDVAALVNAGYDNPNLDAIAATLDGVDSGVAGWGRAALAAGTQVNGSTVPLVGMRDGFEAVARIPVVSGRLPTAADEVALGNLTADELGVDVGDEVNITSRYGGRTGTVTGFVVLPTVGPLESDRASLGNGLLLPPAFLDELMAGAAESLGMSGAAIADSLGSFVVIDLEEGVDPGAWLREHEESMVAWDPFGTPPLAYAEPVRPSVVIDIEAMQSVPTLLAAVIAAAMSVSVVAGVVAGTRARRRELAILRALGGSARQVRASVRWHALAVVATGLVLGLAPGVALGRAAYSAFARSIGVAADPRVPLGLLGVLVVAVLALGVAAAALPGRRVASHATVADALLAEAARTTG